MDPARLASLWQATYKETMRTARANAPSRPASVWLSASLYVSLALARGRRPVSFGRQASSALVLLCALPGLCSTALAAPLTEPVTVQAQREGGAVRVTTEAVARAPLTLIWGALTDYNHLAEFVPAWSAAARWKGAATAWLWRSRARPVSGFSPTPLT